MLFNPYPITLSDWNALVNTCPLNEYTVIDPADSPIWIPTKFRDKCIKAVIVGSGNDTNAVYMINYLRVDSPQYEIDQEPFCVTLSQSSQARLYSGFIHHGSWEGRTVPIEPEFLAVIKESGIERHFPYIGVPQKARGPITDLKPDSHKQAFSASIKAMIHNPQFPKDWMH